MKWYKHDTNAHADAKLKKVRMKYGLEGYGLYWYCLELIAASVDVDNLTFELEHDAEIIAHDTGIHYERVNEMMAYMVDLGLFENDSGIVKCLKLAKRLDKSMTSNPKMRGMIDQVRKDHDGVMTGSDKVMQDKIRLDKNRIDNKTPKNSSLCGIEFETKDGLWICPDDYYQVCVERYGKSNVDQEFKVAAFWLTSNPSKRKTSRGMKKFLGVWLQRKAASDPSFKAPEKPVVAESQFHRGELTDDRKQKNEQMRSGIADLISEIQQ